MQVPFFLFAAVSVASAQANPPPAPPTGADVRLLFSADDYPAEALKRNEQGTARAELTIGTEGRVKACKIIQSTNSAALDLATCKILTDRARFIPARAANGNAVEDTVVTPAITWKVEEDAEPAVPQMQQVEPGRYLCDTDAGHFAQQELLPIQPGQELRLGFRLVEDHVSDQWTVLAAVYFIGPNGKSRVAVGKAQNDRTQIFVAVSTPGNETDDVIFQFPVTSSWIILNLNLDKRGRLTVRSNDLTKRYQWGTVTRTYLHCNSGKWEFDAWPRSYAPASLPAQASPTSP